MATTFASNNLGASIGWTYQGVGGISPSLNQPQTLSYAPTQYANGTGLNQCDRIFAQSGTIAASGNTSVTLTSFTDFLGNSVSMLRFKLLWIENQTATTASQINVGNATNPLANWISATSTTVAVRNGGILLLNAPDATAYPIVASTSDTIKLTNADGANTATYRLIILGCSA